MSKYFFLAFLFYYSNSYSQLNVLNTYTTQVLNSISKQTNVVLIGGIDNYISKSFNDCDSIKLINSPASSTGWSEVSIIDSNTYFIFYRIGSSTIIYKTVDGGNNWLQKLNMDTAIGKEFKMFNKQDGILLCTQGVNYFTNNGGDSWYIDSNGINNSESLAMHGDSTIYIGQSLGDKLFYSINQGHNWSSIINLPYQSATRSIFLLNDTCVYSLILGQFSDKYMSFCLNRNSNMTNKTISIDEAYDLHFLSFSEGYIVGYKYLHGTILKTNDTGNTWIEYQTSYLGAFTRITFLNDSIALIAGTNGYLAKWNKNSFALSVVNEGKQINNKISIYPNPTTNSQQIEIELVKDADLEINLISILGQKLKNVHHQKQSKGNIKINSDLTDLSCGIYFYEIIIDNKKQYIKTIKN